MNVRFSDRNIRFRITRDELDRLLSGRSLSLSVPMPHAHQFRANIGIAPVGDWQLDSDPTGLWLSIPRSIVEDLEQSLPRKEGLKHDFSGPLTVLFEVDLRKETKAAA
ncbi:MAG TPA: hypothetical protein VET48_13920 [Steroidobacteraceae bacterium]|nr:hypothetical protein [Steroidobacteraceae bacterium]